MNPDRDQMVKELDLDNRVRYEVVETLASLGPATFFISSINALIAFFVLLPIANHLVLNLWLGFILTVILARLLMVIKFWRTKKEQLNITLWSFFYLLLIYLTGVAWGALPLLGAQEEESWAWGFIIFLIAGMATGGAMTLYAKLSAVIPYLALVLLPMIYVMASGDHPSDFAMAVLGGLFLVTMVRSSYYLNSMVLRTIRLDAENQHLFEFLLKAKRHQDS